MYYEKIYNLIKLLKKKIWTHGHSCSRPKTVYVYVPTSDWGHTIQMLTLVGEI